MSQSFDCLNLKKWFVRERRDLPWRDQPDPYAVWVSEVMLQQTQVSVVIPYFDRWMNRFPTLRHLAKATLDEVIKEWEGLGYYSRARNLHEGARYVLEKHEGILPETQEELQKIKGLGPYTIGAIRSFAFHHKAAAVDGNVIRVLTRYFKIEEDIAKPKTIQMIRDRAEVILPEIEPWIVAEALIELGATLCTKKPKCQSCPLKASCASYQQGVVDQIPYKSAKVQIEFLYRAVAVIMCGDQFLIKRGKKGEIMSDLYEFPYFEIAEEGVSSEVFAKRVSDELKMDLFFDSQLPRVNHSFTRYRVRLDPILFRCHSRVLCPGNQWMSTTELNKLAFSSGHRQIFSIVKFEAL